MERIDGIIVAFVASVGWISAFVFAHEYNKLRQSQERVRQALELALRAIDAYWPDDPPENAMEAAEDAAIARVRREARAALAKGEKE